MKKYLIAIFIIFVALVGFSSCALNDNDINAINNHTHLFSEWEVLNQASCLNSGRQQRICSLCDYVEDEEIKIMPHTIVSSPAVLPTCKNEGKTEGKYCAVCEIVLEVPASIPSTEHRYDDGVVLEKAFFWNPGKITYSCIYDQCDMYYEQTYTVTTVNQIDNTIINSNKLYSFCALSDVHITYETASEDFQRALMYAEENCAFTCIAGDLTENAAVESQLASYKNIVDTYAQTKPVYAISGNHDNYNGFSDSYLENYTGQPLYYSFTQGNDVFIMVGHYGSYYGDGIGWLPSEFVSEEELQWLYETLEANRDKRCFVFTHVLPHEHGVGNPDDLYENSGKPLLWDINDGGVGQAFVNLLKHYKNAILFHGHSHTKLDLQNLAANANCSDENGYRSVHIPSLSVPRDEKNGIMIDVYEESEGYIIEAYEDCIVLKGRDFITGDWIDGATYKIDTELYTIEANTFIDDTGIIKTVDQ